MLWRRVQNPTCRKEQILAWAVSHEDVRNRDTYKNLVGEWFIASSEYLVVDRNGVPVFKNPVDSAKQLSRIARIVAEGGYHRFGEMFMWGGELMDACPGIAEVIRDRFPIFLLDEAQDNSEEQSKILHRIFVAGPAPVIRQRFGDSNQAIFNVAGDKGAQTDQFPNDSIKKDLPSSHRFGMTIAELAGRLGLTQYQNGLVGQGPQTSHASVEPQCKHSIFLFDEHGTKKVLDAYGTLLVETFPEKELRNGTFTAVGAVHKINSDNHAPRHVGHYWPDYDPELSKSDPKPRTFVQYIFAGQSEAGVSGEVYPAIEKIAEGLLRLSGMTDQHVQIKRRKNRHRYVLQLLQDAPQRRACYRILSSQFALRRRILTQAAWNGRWCLAIRKIAEAIAGVPLSGSSVDAFLAWSSETYPSPSASKAQVGRNNIYRYPHDEPKVQIRVGSIHSVKGQTHTATLVLETFWRAHNLADILSWIDGSERGSSSTKIQLPARLRMHYVAMTRPTHLVCLAMKRSTFENEKNELDQEKVEKLTDHGWDVREVN